MKILFVTETWDASTGPYETLYPWIRDALRNMGHDVIDVDNKASRSLLKTFGATIYDYPRWAIKLQMHRLNDWLVNRRARVVARDYQPDLIVIVKGENITYETMHYFKQHTSAIITNWDHDNPFWPDNTSIDLLRSIPQYDFFCALSRNIIPALYSIGCHRVEYMPMYFIPERFHLESPISDTDREKYSCDVIFVGNGSHKRAELLRHLMDFDLQIWGSWAHILDPQDPLHEYLKGPPLTGREYARAVQCAKIAVNVLNVHNSQGSNLRTFEVPGIGGFLITEYSKEQAHELFTEEKNIVCYSSPKDLVDKVTYYLNHANERRRIAEAGHVHVEGIHTLQHRLQQIISIAEEMRDGTAQE